MDSRLRGNRVLQSLRWVEGFGVLRQAQDERLGLGVGYCLRGGGGVGGRGLEFEEDGFNFFNVGVGGEAPDSDVATTEVAVGVPVGGNGDPFVVYFLPVG